MNNSSGDSAAAAGIFGAFMLIYFLFIVGIFALMIWIQWRILVKAGFSGWLSLLLLTGIGGLVVQLILAFGRWPIEDQLAAAQAGQPIPVSNPNPFAGPPVVQ
jgi:uncharacterized membrane protein YhaH (DUF805 family)